MFGPEEEEDDDGWTIQALEEADQDYWEQKEYEDTVPDPEPASADDPWWMGTRSDW